MRSQILRHSSWMPLSQLLSSDAHTRAEAGLFYAESWALTEMLILSPEYKTHLPELLTKLSTGVSGLNALTAVYHKSPDTITRDARQWVESGKIPVAILPPVNTDKAAIRVSKMSPFESRCLMAELLFDIGDLNRAEAAYRALHQEYPNNATVEAALGNIALRRGDREGARHSWELAMQHGISDANLCYRYALLAGDMGLPEGEIKTALEQAVALQPEFDDARYKLALMENNGGQYSAALGQLLAMKHVGAVRVYAYWSAIAYAHEQLDQREEAKAAATKALQYATTQAERDRAAQLLYLAETDITVQATRDANGNIQFATTRVKHGSEHWNPFIEPEDQIVRVHARLIRVECKNNTMTGVGVDTGKTVLALGIANPSQVLMRNAPQEFTCGSQNPAPVIVEYAVAKQKGSNDGLLRGMEFDK